MATGPVNDSLNRKIGLRDRQAAAHEIGQPAVIERFVLGIGDDERFDSRTELFAKLGKKMTAAVHAGQQNESGHLGTDA
jgi:hypothetical protein